MGICFEYEPLFRWRSRWFCMGGDVMDNDLFVFEYDGVICGPYSREMGHTEDSVRAHIVPLIQSHRMNRKGWICPRCDTVVSPDEKTCPNCKPKPKEEKANGNPTRISE